jgi:hypothetical protein
MDSSIKTNRVKSSLSAFDPFAEICDIGLEAGAVLATETFRAALYRLNQAQELHREMLA